jgi:hypothetical protein
MGYNIVMMVLQWCYNDVAIVLQSCCSGVPVDFTSSAAIAALREVRPLYTHTHTHTHTQINTHMNKLIH